MRFRASRRLLNSKGQGLAEYIIIVVIVAIAVVVAVRMFGGSLMDRFENATEEIENVRDGGLEVGDASPDSSSTRVDSGASTVVEEHGNGGAVGETSPGTGGGSSNLEDLRPAGVGEKDPVGRIEVDWSTMGFWAMLVCSGGLVVVFRIYTKGKKKKRPPKKSKLKSLLSDNGDQ